MWQEGWLFPSPSVRASPVTWPELLPLASRRSQTPLSSGRTVGASVFAAVSSSCAEQQDADVSVRPQRWWYGAVPCPARWVRGVGTVLLPDTPDTAGWCQPQAARPAASRFLGLVTPSALTVLNYLRVGN